MNPVEHTPQADALGPLDEGDLLAEVIRALLPKPADIRIVKEKGDGGLIRLNVLVSQEHKRFVIGRRGKVISAIRQLFSFIGAVDGRQLIVKVP